jgi:hypothetical protein
MSRLKNADARARTSRNAAPKTRPSWNCSQRRKRRIRTSPERPVAVLRASCGRTWSGTPVLSLRAGPLRPIRSLSTRRQPAAADRVRVIDEVRQGTRKTITAPDMKNSLAYSNTCRIAKQREQSLPIEISDISNPFWVGVLPPRHVVRNFARLTSFPRLATACRGMTSDRFAVPE